MKKNLLSVLALATLLGLLVACSNGAVPVDAQNEDVSTTQREETQGIHGFLTRVEYGDNTVYLFGDFWATRSEFPPFASIVEEAMQRTDVFFTRDNPTAMDDPEYLEFLMSRFYFPPGITLESYLPSDIYENFSKILDEYNFGTYVNTAFPLAILQSFIPFELVGRLSAEPFSMDEYIQEYAILAGRPLYFFFDSFWFIDVLLPQTEAIQFAAATSILPIEDALARAKSTLNAYKQQNETLLIELLLNSADGGGNEFAQFLVGLDLLVAEEFKFGIAELLRETEEPTTFFIPVWVENMIGDGDTNVTKLLEREGFVVTRMFE